jgi:hypothetical protein
MADEQSNIANVFVCARHAHCLSRGKVGLYSRQHDVTDARAHTGNAEHSGAGNCAQKRQGEVRGARSLT